MKKYLLITLFLVATKNYAQKITLDDLQGRWDLVYCSANNFTLDVKAKKLELSPELRERLSAEQVERINSNLAETIKALSLSYADFKDSICEMSLGPALERGPFEIKERDGQNFLFVGGDDGSTEEAPIFIKDKKLYLKLLDEEENYIFVFERQ